ncbi:MAG: CatB-related O-acetyltransferase [Lachnospiraceae bacterium]|nr:CatB-related O-acetyltransferase [Lachnospiraceae bacterium]
MPSGRTRIGSDVWLGNDVRIMGGVKIGDGAVVGTGALVTKDIPPYSINVGVPAKTIKYRFTEEQIEKLLTSKWWEKDEQWINSNIDRFSDVEVFFK